MVTKPGEFRERREAGLDAKLNSLLLELNERYSEMGQRAITDFSNTEYHNHEILNILEAQQLMIYYQVDKDWFYRTEERRWIAMHDESEWKKHAKVNGKVEITRLHLL